MGHNAKIRWARKMLRAELAKMDANLNEGQKEHLFNLANAQMMKALESGELDLSEYEDDGKGETTDDA